MRIACVHVPQFALQCLSRVDPSLSAGAPVAVVGAGAADGASFGRPRSWVALNSPIVLAFTRAAWGQGVRLGMTAAAVRALGDGIRVVPADSGLERETVRAIADALLGVAPLVDVGGRVGAGGAHLAMYCEVPAKTRGASFGERLLEVLGALGVTGRIGIADDRFTAWVAAAYGGAEDRGVLSVPRGGSAAFLAPRPLALLAITPEVQHMLEALGVHTLGEFAALPAPSVARPLEADYQALARGESGHALRPYAPEAPIREEQAIAAFGRDGTLFGGAAAVAVIAERIALRLAGRGRGAARLEVTVQPAGGAGGAGETRVLALSPVADGRVLGTVAELGEAIAPLVGEVGATARVGVVVTGEALAGDAAIGEAARAAATAPALDALALVLSSAAVDHPGWSQGRAWELLAPTAPVALRSERRDAHRRTRRGKQRRRVIAPAAQSRLFGG